MTHSLRACLSASVSLVVALVSLAGCGAVLPKGAPTFAVHDFGPLAPVGALLGTLGYATGTGLAWLTGLMLQRLAGAG